jgi:NADPH2:quinone reductase
LRIEDMPDPEPGAGEVLIAVRAAGLNFPDVLMAQGLYQLKPPLPFVPGMEIAGEIAALGEGVDTFAVGDPVLAEPRPGGLAERVAMPATRVRPMPAGLDYAQGAALTIAYLTALVCLDRRGQVKAGETVLVHGAAGGVGLAAVDIARCLGAKVIAAASTPEKRAVLEARGADHVIDGAPGFYETVRELTDGRGADVVYDPVGGDVFTESTRCIAWNGRLVVVGFASGTIPTLEVNRALIKGFSVVGARAGEWGRRDPEDGKRCMQEIDALAASGRIAPHVGAKVPFERAVEGLRLLQERRAIGKVVVEF